MLAEEGVSNLAMWGLLGQRVVRAGVESFRVQKMERELTAELIGQG
jgi:hypothetical protein